MEQQTQPPEATPHFYSAAAAKQACGVSGEAAQSEKQAFATEGAGGSTEEGDSAWWAGFYGKGMLKKLRI